LSNELVWPSLVTDTLAALQLRTGSRRPRGRAALIRDLVVQADTVFGYSSTQNVVCEWPREMPMARLTGTLIVELEY
jgi:hypothetical protein